MVQTVNVTLDDYSPVIEYLPHGMWVDGSTADPYWNSYTNNGTFTLTTTYGAYATLTFNGTAIWVLGAKRGNHGPYNITLDGELYQDDGFYDGQIFQQVLFSAIDLDGTQPHTMSIINSYSDPARPYLDIDTIVYQMELPDDDQVVEQDDGDGSFQYSQSGWGENPENVVDYHDGTGHSTSLGNAYVNYTFQGTQVELYGAVGPFGGVFTVQLDDGPAVILNASRTKFTPQMVLYQQTGLSPGSHTVRLTNAPFSDQTLSIDYATFVRSSNSNSPSPAPSSTTSSSLNGGVIGGIAAGISGLVIVTMVILLVWYRRRYKQPTIHPHEVLRAEFASENGDDREAGDSSTRLTPYLDSTITRYRAVSPPIPVSLPGAGSGHSFSALSGPQLYQSSYQSQPEIQSQFRFPSLPQPPSQPWQSEPQSRPRSVSGPTPGMRLVVQNAGTNGTNEKGQVDSAVEEKRRLAAVLRERDNRSLEFNRDGSGNGDSFVPLRYQ